jgi:hypothetical protein
MPTEWNESNVMISPGSEAPWFWKDPQTAIGVSDKNIQLTEASVILHKLHRYS